MRDELPINIHEAPLIVDASQGGANIDVSPLSTTRYTPEPQVINNLSVNYLLLLLRKTNVAVGVVELIFLQVIKVC